MVYILLNDEGFVLRLAVLTSKAWAVRYQLLDFWYVRRHIYSITSVRIFSRLNNPDVLRHLIPSLDLSYLLILIEVIKLIVHSIHIFVIICFVIVIIVLPLLNFRLLDRRRISSINARLLLLLLNGLKFFISSLKGFLPLGLHLLCLLCCLVKVIFKSLKLCAIDVTLLN